MPMPAPNDDPQKLWDQPQRNVALGCSQCPHLRTNCGGLHVDSPIWNCMGLCCNEPETCTLVCKAKPAEYLHRLNEIGGFTLEPIPEHVGVPCGSIPDFVPIFFHGKARHSDLRVPAVAFPLRYLFHQATGKPRFASKSELLRHLRVAEGAQLVITGVAEDRYIERYWDVGRAADIVQNLSDLAPDLVTVPNYTLYLNRPRFEDMYNLKRISKTFGELVVAGVPTALHVNARTKHDFAKWVKYIRHTPAVRTIAFEFGTGATIKRQPHYANMLLELNRQVGRPLTLVVRGGLLVLHQLREGFDRVVFLDSTAFSKSRSRQRANLPSPLKLRWSSSPTMPGECLNNLLSLNTEIYARYVANRAKQVQLAARRIA